MDELSLKESLSLVKKYNSTPQKSRDILRMQRLYAMVTYAKTHSELYRNHYANLKENFLLRDVPPITLEALNESKLKWECEGIIENNIAVAINQLRTFPFEREYRSFKLHGSREVIISATEESPYLSTWEKSTTIISVFDPIDKIVEQLNKIKPVLLWAYPSVLEKLLIEKKSGALKIKPIMIIAGGENLTRKLRRILIENFQCTVVGCYSSKEAGVIAYECEKGRMHINDDWIILEPVDENGRPVMDGITGDNLLITNLYKTDKPVIRMRVPDKITIHNEECTCGNISPWIIIESGRKASVHFDATSNENEVPVNDIEKLLKSISGVKDFQLVIYIGDNVSVRLETEDENMKPVVFLTVEQQLRKFFKEKGITIKTITLDKDSPKPDEDTGKFKSVIDFR